MKLSTFVLGGMAIVGAIMLGLGIAAENAARHRPPQTFAAQDWLNNRISGVHHRYAVVEFYNGKNPESISHLKDLRLIVRDQYAAQAEVVPVDVSREADWIVLAQLPGGYDVLQYPYTMVVEINGGIIKAGSLYLSVVYHRPSVHICRVLEDGIEPTS